MQKSDPRGAKPAFGLQDVLYVLFKHKWKIMVSSALGLGAAATLYVTRKPLYESEAELVIKSVLQRDALDGHEVETAAGGRGGEQVVNTEMLILRSGDLAKEVAAAIGPERLLPEAGEAARLIDAAAVVQGGIEVKPASKGSNVVLVIYRNPDPQLTVDVLNEVVKRYYQKHLEIHRSLSAFEAVAKQVEEVGTKLRKTEADLNKLKSESGIISLTDETVSLSSQRERTKQDLNGARAELAQQMTLVDHLERRLSEVAGGSITPIGSQVVPKKSEPAAPAAPTAAQIESYQALSKRIEFLQQRDFELGAKYAAGDSQVVNNRRELTQARAEKQGMLEKSPGLVAQATATQGAPVANPADELKVEQTKLDGLQARIASYQTDLETCNSRITQLSVIGPKIIDLERRREMEDTEYRNSEKSLKQAKIDVELDPSKISEIRVVDQPSAPVKTFSDMMKKIILGLAGAGVGVGVGIAFLLELVIDRRIKRPNEIESRLQLPLMLSIPFVQPKNRGALLISNDRTADGEGERNALPAVRGADGFNAFPPKTDHFIHPYSEAIRDRIVFNFQVNNMTHKPKLMAVTGLSAGAGASTIAAGLAKAFSEVNGAKVLLVDLTSEFPDDNPMFGNKPLHSLVGALQAARNTRFKEGSQNLYLASAASRKSEPGAAAFGPMHLYELLPHFRASEFDYIIFDMPAMAQTSPTLAMAGLMDKVLLVVDGEDTNRETLKWGYSELVKGRADVSCIYNKARSHAPSWVLGEA
ncbi:GumC family protein [Luteolibacter sp. Populi]|uniref:GumC family protein n=1 Tax=Luteolibacter sp. Populi TaxID=3230487 RepID=UPI003466521C